MSATLEQLTLLSDFREYVDTVGGRQAFCDFHGITEDLP